MSSADLVHRNGFGSVLWTSMKARMSASRAFGGVVNPAADLLFGDQGEEAFDLIDP